MHLYRNSGFVIAGARAAEVHSHLQMHDIRYLRDIPLLFRSGPVSAALLSGGAGGADGGEDLPALAGGPPAAS